MMEEGKEVLETMKKFDENEWATHEKYQKKFDHYEEVVDYVDDDDVSEYKMGL
jgi:hypothetical protein